LTEIACSVSVCIHAAEARLKQHNEEMQMRKGIHVFQHRRFAGNFGDRSIAESLGVMSGGKGEGSDNTDMGS